MPLRPYQDYRRYAGPERPAKTADLEAYPAWAPPRWTLGLFWRWWIADPTRILIQDAVGILLAVVWWVLVIAFDASGSWALAGVGLTAFATLPVALYGPRVWRERRRRRTG